MSAAPALAGWESFYVIIGSAAAGLTGLTFVVIALAADANMTHLSGLKTFVSPTVIHFSSALWIAALCNLPHHTHNTLGITAAASGILGVAYTARTMARMARMDANDYLPVAEDWIWNGTLPLASYAMLGIGGALVWRAALVAGYGIGLSALLLIFVGIHNVWDLAVWILAERPSRHREMQGAARPHRDAAGPDEPP